MERLLPEQDPDHERCTDLLDSAEEQLIIPAPVLGELDYWVTKFSSADIWLAFCEDLHGGAYRIYPLDAELLVAAARLQARYADLPLSLVDAAVFATCETLDEPKVATLDHRDFGVLRTARGRALELLR